MWWQNKHSTWALTWVSLCHVTSAFDVDLTSEDSIKTAASNLAFDMMTYYTGNLSGQIPGQLPGPPPNPKVTNAGYFWWETGAMFGSLMDYWYYTADATYNDEVMAGMLHQTGDNNDYLPTNQTNGMGNDDQAFWGMAAMTAAELNFPNPPSGQPQWLALAQAVYNTQLARFDDLCGGGLHWQAYSFLNGYTYKNSIANGCFFNIAARLALYTGNATYATEATNTWDWVTAIGLIDNNWYVYDGTDSTTNCSSINHQQYSYNPAVFLLGAATMFNFTTGAEQALWQTRAQGLLQGILQVFFPDGIAYEVACEKQLTTCTIDMLSYKAYLIRWMAASTKVAPFLYDDVMPAIQTSAAAAAQQCVGTVADHPSGNGRMCGLSWSMKGTWDGTSGVGQQMAALEAITSNLIGQSRAPATNTTGGTSAGDPNAGIDDPSNDPTAQTPATGADKAGAGILTALVVIIIVGGLVWLSMPDRSALS